MQTEISEVGINEIDLTLLKKKFVEGDEFEKLDSIYLKGVKEYVVEVLNDESFRKAYNLQDLEKLVYYENKMLMLFCPIFITNPQRKPQTKVNSQKNLFRLSLQIKS